MNGAFEILSSPRIDAIGHSANPRNNSNVKQSPNQTPEDLRKLREELFKNLINSGFNPIEANAMTDIRKLTDKKIEDKINYYNNLIRKGFNKKIDGEKKLIKKLINDWVVDETILKEIERKLSPELHKNLLKLEKKTGAVHDFLNNNECENIDVLSNFLDERDIEHDVGALEREMFLQKGYDPVDIDEAVKIYNNCVDVDKFLSELKKIRRGKEINELLDLVDNDKTGYIKAISLLEGKNPKNAKAFSDNLNKQTLKILGIKANEELKKFTKTLKSIAPGEKITQKFIDRHNQEYYDKNKEKYKKAIYATYKKNGDRFLYTEHFLRANRLAGGKPRKSRRKPQKSRRKQSHKARRTCRRTH